ncbi:hypothetical protein D3C71_1380720 [compost metagenome]
MACNWGARRRAASRVRPASMAPRRMFKSGSNAASSTRVARAAIGALIWPCSTSQPADSSAATVARCPVIAMAMPTWASIWLRRISAAICWRSAASTCCNWWCRRPAITSSVWPPTASITAARKCSPAKLRLMAVAKPRRMHQAMQATPPANTRAPTSRPLRQSRNSPKASAVATVLASRAAAGVKRRRYTASSASMSEVRR